jgi:hypothetical protein
MQNSTILGLTWKCILKCRSIGSIEKNKYNNILDMDTKILVGLKDKRLNYPCNRPCRPIGL